MPLIVVDCVPPEPFARVVFNVQDLESAGSRLRRLAEI
jgi:hypothetical protein